MSEELTTTRLATIYAKIESDADDIARNDTGYIEDEEDNALGRYQPKRLDYQRRKRYYKMGATLYGKQLAEAHELIEKMGKALREISELQTISGTPENWLILAVRIATEALTTKQTTDDTANG